VNSEVKHTVLVVDDTESNIDILVDALGDMYDVSVAIDGESALEIAREDRPDLILLDIMMPGIDGYQVCTELKNERSTKNIPIIFLTAMTEIKDKAKGFELGAVDYITKPFEVVEVQARVKTHLALRILTRSLKQEHKRSESLLHNILPEEIAERLKNSNEAIADRYDNVSVLFADMVNFTPLAQKLDPTVLVTLLNKFFSYFDDLTEKYGLEKIKTIGDSYMVASGLPIPREDHAVAIMNMAIDMLKFVETHESSQDEKLQLRIGIHSGSVVAGVIGKIKFIYDLWGDVVNTASRLESHGIPGNIHISEETYELLKKDFIFKPRGEIEVKGKGKMKTYFLKKEPPDYESLI